MYGRTRIFILNACPATLVQRRRLSNVGTTQRDAQESYPTTIWSLNWLPLGGFVRLKGEQDTTNKDTDSFASKSAWARAWILVAGVLMNWLLAFFIFSAGFLFGVPTDLEGVPSQAIVRDRRVEITQILSDSPAAKAGIQAGDRVMRIGERSVADAQEARAVLGEQSASQASFPIVLEREGQSVEVVAQPAYLASLQRAGVGVGLADVGVVRLPFYRAFPQAAVTTYTFTKMIVTGFGQIIRNLVVDHKTEAQLSGPVGIAVMTGKVASQGIWPLLQFAALLSINLAVVNLLPIPALDGGRLLFVGIEVLRGRRKSLVWEGRLHQVGFILLLTLIVFITIRDVGIYGAPIWEALKQRVGF